MAVYLHLFHGRDTVDQDMDDWGFDGPVIGPLDYAHITYMTDIKFACSRDVAKQFFPEGAKRDEDFVAQHPDSTMLNYPFEDRLVSVEGLIEHGGKYYGDFSIAATPQKAEDFNAPTD